ncbi:Sporulation stage III protein AE [[Clostridium] cellulosi]|uniref:Sporulation stage III protein AE n=1 Tax=[Clostridium] cellulosi TaxID=29343 RepID=A0A078KNP9_9FIRM|nr:Sporulation stage III protein AE [[Clostridium] cellulosi]
MKKTGILIITFIIFNILFCQTVSAKSNNETPSSVESIISEQQEKSRAGELSEKVPDSAENSLKKAGIKSGDKDTLARFTPANIFGALIDAVKSAAKSPLKAIAAVTGILLACALLATLKNSFAESSMHNVFNVVTALCVASVILVPITQCISFCATVIKQSSTFMLAFIPVYTALAAASGHPASAIATQSLLLGSSEILSQIVSTTFVPMADIYLAFCVIAAVSPQINITGIAEFIKSAVSWALGLCLTIYTGILTVQGAIASATDNVTIKAAKFVVDGSIPVIGGAISDAMNTVISCAGLLKTSVGAYAIVVLILAFLPPVLECVMWLLATDISLAVANILNISNMNGMLKAIKEALKLIIALVIASALTFVISVSVMLLLGK